MIPLSLSPRQKNVLACVIAFNAEGVRPYTYDVAARMNKEGHTITERQCAYDLGIIIHTKGSGCYSAKFGNDPKIWLYQENMSASQLEFPNLNAAMQWCDDNGYSYGSLCNAMPIGILKGDFLIAKWRNLTEKERDELDGQITLSADGDWRNGPVVITLKKAGGEQP